MPLVEPAAPAAAAAAEEGSEAESEEARVPRAARDPGEPSDEERRRHECTHLPYRSWCRYCVQGRMQNPPHQSHTGGAHDVPEVALDYCFLAKDTSDKSLTVLVIKDRNSRAILAHPVLCKGRQHSGTVEQAVCSIRRLGHQHKVILKTDNEPALVDLRNEVARALGLQALPEAPPAYEPQSNGGVENAVKQLKGLIRTLMLALQARIQGEVPVDHPLMLWLVEHAAELLTKHLVGHDGRTAFERLFGKACREDGYEFGESVHYKLKPTETDRSLSARWETGTWLGRRWGTGSHIVAGGPGEVREVRAVARRPLSERWSRETLQELRAVPWAWRMAPPAAGEVPQVIPHVAVEAEAPALPRGSVVLAPGASGSPSG